MVNTQTCTSCLNGVKTFFLTKSGKKKELFFKILFMACKFVMTCHDKNVICDCMIPKKKGGRKKVI